MPARITNAPSNRPAARGVCSAAAETVTVLYARIVAGNNFDTVCEDQAQLCAVLADVSALAPQRAAQQLNNCTLGKALHVLCQIWRHRGTVRYDRQALIEAAHVCGVLIEQRSRFALETCGVIMFHLGELLTIPSLTQRYVALVCDHLAPHFRNELLGRGAGMLTGPDATFGLISALRASEHQLVNEHGVVCEWTAADDLVSSLFLVLQRQPELLEKCESGALGLLARHAMHYLRRLDAVPIGATVAASLQARQRGIAQLVKRCIDEVDTPQPRAADARTLRPPPGFGGHLRDARPCYVAWLARQSCEVQRQLALRGACGQSNEDPFTVPDTDTAAAITCPEDRTDPRSTPLSRLEDAAAALSREVGMPSRPLGERARVAADDVIDWINNVSPPLTARTRARMLLDLDTVYRHAINALPLGGASSAEMVGLNGFQQAQLGLLVDAAGKPVLGPALPSPGGLHSWQRMLLGTLLE